MELRGDKMVEKLIELLESIPPTNPINLARRSEIIRKIYELTNRQA